MSHRPKSPMTLRDTVQARRNRDDQPPTGEGDEKEAFGWIGWPGRAALLVALAIAPWMIGSVGSQARFILSILVAVAMGSWWLTMAIRSSYQRSMVPWIALLVLCGIVVGLFQTAPLPESAPSWLAGKQKEIYQQWSAPACALDENARKELPFSVSVNTEATWNQLLLLIVAVGAMMSAAGLFQKTSQSILLMWVLCINGSLLSFFGMIQKLTDNGKIFWTIDLTFGGTPFASYVNRNNASGFLLVCLASAIGLTIYLWKRDASRGPALMISHEMPIWRQCSTWVQMMLADLTATKLAVLLSLVLIASGIVSTLSRGGVIAMLTGGMTSLIFYGMARRPQAGSLMAVPMVVAILALTGWIGFYDKLIDRFEEKSAGLVSVSEDNGRLRSWSETLTVVPQMGVLGSGLGTYPQMHRMSSTLTETVIFEYAENQFVQSLVDGGVVSLLLLLAAVYLAMYASLSLLYRGSSPATIAWGILGVFLVVSQVVASIFDFGWYIPANCIAVSTMIGALSFQAHSLAGRLRKATMFRWNVPTILAKGLALAVFAGVVISSLTYSRQAEWDSRKIRSVTDLLPDELDLEATETHLQQMSKLLAAYGSPQASQLEYVGDLWLRVARLNFYQSLLEAIPLNSLSDDKQANKRRNLWELTTQDRILEHVRILSTQAGSSFATEFLMNRGLMDQMSTAARLWYLSARANPLKPELSTRIGRFQIIAGNDSIGEATLARTAVMVPGSVANHHNAAVALLICGRQDAAVPRLKRMLELNPQHFVRMINLIKGRTARLPRPLDDATIIKYVLPDNPRQIYEFAVNQMDPESGDLKRSLLEKAISLLEGTPKSDHENMVLMGHVHLELGNREEAIICYDTSMTSDSNDLNTRYKLAKLLMEQGELEEAHLHAQRLLESGRKLASFNKLYEEIQKLRLEQRAESGSVDGDVGF